MMGGIPRRGGPACAQGPHHSHLHPTGSGHEAPMCRLQMAWRPRCTRDVSTQCCNDAQIRCHHPQESWLTPGTGVSHHCPPTLTSRCHTLVVTACLQGDWQGQLLPLLQTPPRAWEAQEQAPMGTRTLRDWVAPAAPGSPAPADCSHDQRRDPGHRAHHNQPYRGGRGHRGTVGEAGATVPPAHAFMAWT